MTEKKIFSRNFITEVILRVDFNNPIRLTSETIKQFHGSLPFEKKEYTEQSIKGYELKIEKGNETFAISQVGKSGIFSISDFGHPIKFVLDHEKFLLTVLKYEQFSSFFEYFKKGFEEFQKIQKVTEFKRIGLRFINIIPLGDEEVRTQSDWKEFINSTFLPEYSSIIIPETELTLRRNINHFIFGDGELFLYIRLGLWNNSFPGMISDKEFVLDIDCYIDNRILSDTDILEVPIKMSERTAKSFYSLITPRLEKILKEKR